MRSRAIWATVLAALAGCGPGAQPDSIAGGELAPVLDDALQGSPTPSDHEAASGDPDDPSRRNSVFRTMSPEAAPTKESVATLSPAARELRERRLAPPDALETFTTMASVTAAGASTARMSARSMPVPGEEGLFEVILNNTGSGWQERFLLFLPDVAPQARVPMLVVFHKFGVSHWDAYYNTTFLTEARNRGWVLVAPLSASGVNYGCIEGQINTRAVLDLVTSIYPVDKDRVYGVGFSMGAGTALSYAARNLDPAHVMFAAICDHTGGVSLSHTYFNETDDNDADDNIPVFGANLEVPDILDYWFEGPPWVYTFNYQRCQSIEIHPFTGQIVPNTDMARNLKHVPTLVWLGNADPFALMVEQTMAFYGHIQSFHPSNMLTIASSSFHWWGSIDENVVCNFFAQFSLELPTSGRIMADETGVFLHFQVLQDAAFHLTPFTWSVNPVQNQLNVNETANLRRLSVDVTKLGLNYAQNLKVNLFTADGTGDEIQLLEMAAPPSAVLRDGQSTSAIYDPEARSLLIQETSPTPHQWIIVP